MCEKPKTKGRLGENDALDITLDGKHVATLKRSSEGRFGLDFHGKSNFRVKRRKLATGGVRTSKVTKRKPGRAHRQT